MKLNHIDLQVSDVDRARAFFETVFGMRCTYQRRSEIAILDDGSGFVLGVSNLFGSPAPVYPPDFHIGFPVAGEAEVRAKYEEVRSLGVPIRVEPSIGGPTLYFVCLAPDGIAVEVSGPRAGA